MKANQRCARGGRLIKDAVDLVDVLAGDFTVSTTRGVPSTVEAKLPFASASGRITAADGAEVQAQLAALDQFGRRWGRHDRVVVVTRHALVQSLAHEGSAGRTSRILHI